MFALKSFSWDHYTRWHAYSGFLFSRRTNEKQLYNIYMLKITEKKGRFLYIEVSERKTICGDKTYRK